MDSFVNEWSSSEPPLDELQMELVSNLNDAQFEPQTRARSNTWPCPRPENFVDPNNDESESNKASTQNLPTDTQQTISHNLTTSKKNSSRRNAWGNLSYADLITHAIGSATDKRLTLSQIYEWMVQNVPYFRDKGDSNSSAGWKNSIRHNLSLHNRFMRVQNEGTGKSSWWMLNPDAKPGKSVRRRAASMETSKYEKRRGRAKKRVEALRNAGITTLNDATPSPSSSISEGLDHFPESPLHSGGFQLSPDFRQRASSNASSCGRLSPIPAIVGLEPDWGFPSQTPDYESSTITPAQASDLDQLAGSLADDLTLQKEFLQGFTNESGNPNQPPPPYHQFPLNSNIGQAYGIQQQNQCPIHKTLPCSCMHNLREGLSPSTGNAEMSPSYPHSEPSSDSLHNFNSILLNSGLNSGDTTALLSHQKLGPSIDENSASTLIGQCMEALNSQTQIDDFHLDNFQGGLECNIEELIQQEMNIDGLLDINIPFSVSNQSTMINNQSSTPLISNNNSPTTTSSIVELPQTNQSNSHSKVQYSQANVTPPSWVH